MTKETSLVVQKHAKCNKVVVLDFSIIEGPLVSPYEFHAAMDDFHEAQHKAERSSVDNMHQDDEIVLDMHRKARQDIVQAKQQPCFSNIFEKVNVTINLPIFQSNHMFAINEYMIEDDNLLVSNISNHIDQYIMQSRGQ